MRRALPALLLILTGSLITACGEDPAAQPDPAIQTAGNGETFNDADVTFASDMIQHHAQALQMVDLARGRTLDPRVHRLVEDIQAAQGPEIEQMTDWLTAWDRPVPATVRDHANAHSEHDMGEVDMGQDMPGMMTEDQIDELADAADSEFQTLWLTMMIQHHQGAIEMAQTQQRQGESTAARDLARQIEEAQTAEIAAMEEMLSS